MGHQDVTITSAGDGPFPDPVGQSAGVWQGVFRDEFNIGSKPDTAVWADHLLEGDHFRCNDNASEVEWYPHNRAGLSISGSVLSLTARYEDPRNPASVGYDPLCPVTLPSGNAGTHTSGMIQSKPGFAYTYGYVEARVKMPSVAGTWPAFWTVAADAQWPSEIDIAEFDSPSSTYWRDSGGIAYGPVSPSSATWTDWHVFGMEWASGSLKFYCDGTQYGSYSNANVTAIPQTLIFNLAIDAGHTTGYPDAMQIDYVRVWNKIGVPAQPVITSVTPGNGVPTGGTVQVAFDAVPGATSYRVTSCPVELVRGRFPVNPARQHRVILADHDQRPHQRRRIHIHGGRAQRHRLFDRIPTRPVNLEARLPWPSPSLPIYCKRRTPAVCPGTAEPSPSGTSLWWRRRPRTSPRVWARQRRPVSRSLRGLSTQPRRTVGWVCTRVW